MDRQHPRKNSAIGSFAQIKKKVNFLGVSAE
jgi:hypothetical protein